MYALEDLLTDPSKAEFVVVTVPTAMAVAETERLVSSLASSGIAVRHVVLNQVMPPPPAPPPSAFDGAKPPPPSYADRLRQGQGACVGELRAIAKAAAGKATQEGDGAAVTEVPWLGEEATGLAGLRELAKHLI